MAGFKLRDFAGYVNMTFTSLSSVPFGTCGRNFWKKFNSLLRCAFSYLTIFLRNSVFAEKCISLFVVEQQSYLVTVRVAAWSYCVRAAVTTIFVYWLVTVIEWLAHTIIHCMIVSGNPCLPQLLFQQSVIGRPRLKISPWICNVKLKNYSLDTLLLGGFISGANTNLGVNRHVARACLFNRKRQHDRQFLLWANETLRR